MQANAFVHCVFVFWGTLNFEILRDLWAVRIRTGRLRDTEYRPRAFRSDFDRFRRRFALPPDGRRRIFFNEQAHLLPARQIQAKRYWLQLGAQMVEPRSTPARPSA